ncbi:reverse transcriptase domain-containing protein [Tanacetum coccineum]
MPRFAPTIRNLLMNKEKLLELAKIPLNENCSAMLLKKLPEKLGDPGKFLIPCNFPGMDVCHALADLGASINLMPLSFWKKLSLPELTPTRMTLELADRSITHPKGLAEDVYVKVGKFHFPTDFVVVDFEADPRVPLILGRSFLRTGRALIDVYGEEITLRVDNEAITFNLDQTTRYSSTNDKSVNQIDIIDEVCEEYAPELLGFSNKSSGGNPTPTSEPLTSEFILEEIEAYLKDDSISLEIDHADCDPEGDIFLIEKLLNNDPFQLPPMDLKQGEVIKAKSSMEEPPELELKDLPSHLEYAYLEENDKLPVIIAKGLKDDEKEALLKVLKSHKRAITWKITDIKGINPYFCTHKILMEDDYKPTVQNQRRVSPVHCVPKKGGITVVANEENESIPTRLVIGWRVCIDYRILNEATRKDHFPLPFMDQMLERLAGNEFYCFLDGFLGYFQILIDPQDQEKTTFTRPYRTFAYRRMRFGLCNAPGTFQRCMMAIFHDMIEKTMEVFMDDFSVFGDSFDLCFSNLEKMLKRRKNKNLVLNWEKCHFMCREGIVLGHKISKSGIEVDRAKVDVIAKLNHPTTVKGVRSFLVFSPRNDPLHHEFAGEIITPPPRIVREHEEYISRMWLLCGNSSSRSPENFHVSPNTIIGSLPIFPIPVQDSDSHREEIDIFPGPDDLMPPDIKEGYYDSEDDKNSTVDEPVLLHTPFPDEDECFDPGDDNDEIDACVAIEVPTYIEEGYYDSERDVFYLEKLLIDDTTHNLFPEVLFDHEPQCFKDESELDTLENMVKVFDPGIWEKTFSLSCVRLSSKDHHYLLFTIVVQILCTRHMKFLFSFGSEDTIFDPGIYAFHFSSQELVAVKCLMEVCSSTCFIPKDE